MKMNDHLQDWLLALESGKYQQTRSVMKRVDNGTTSYCCLGVAADMAACTFNPLRYGDDEGLVRYGVKVDHYDASVSELPEWLMAAMGVTNMDLSALMMMNDTHSFSFREIAKCVREACRRDMSLQDFMREMETLGRWLQTFSLMAEVAA